MVEVRVKTYGQTAIRRRLVRATFAVADHHDGLERAARLIEHQIRANFNLQGTASGPRWKDLAPSTREQKRRSLNARTRANADRVLRASDRLMRSFRPGSPDAIRVLTATLLELGSRVPYGKYHTGTAPRTVIPYRPFNRLSPRTKRRVVQEMQREMFNNVRGRAA